LGRLKPVQQSLVAQARDVRMLYRL